MSNLARTNIYKPRILSFEMQQFGQTFLCWFSGSYNTQRVIFSRFFPFDLLQENFRFQQSITKIAPSFYNTVSNSHLQMWHRNLSLLHVHMNHWIVGNATGFQKGLRVRGVGYRFEISPLKIIIHAGYSHLLSQKLSLASFWQTMSLNKKATQISFQSPHLTSLNLYVSTIRNLRQPDVYKGKGLRYQKDLVNRKEGKKKKIS